MKYLRSLFWLLALLAYSPAHAEEGGTAKADPEQDAMDEICGLAEDIYNAQKAIDRENAIAKVSGAANLTRLNDFGRQVVRRGEELVPLVEAYEKAYKGRPDLTRCIFTLDFDQREWDRLKKKAAKQKKNGEKKAPEKKAQGKGK